MIVPGKVVVVGLGYVGLPLALRTVEAGYDVIGFDTSAERIDQLAAGSSLIDDVSDRMLCEALATNRFRPTAHLDDCEGFDIAIIAVPTPMRDGSPDLAFVSEAAQAVGSVMHRGACVVLESTTYPGTTEDLVVPILEDVSDLVAGVDFAAGFSPERIDPGNVTWTVRNTPKLVSGIDAASLERIASFYASIVDEVVRVTSTRAAELAKLLENTFRHVNIALVNELAVYAYGMDIDIGEVIDAAATKPFGFMPFRPGPGVGGHCLPIDPSYLSWQVRRELGMSFRFVELANDINEHMPDYVVRRVTSVLNGQRMSVNGARVLLLGVAYKKNSADARESPAVRVAELLADLGADLRVADPLVPLTHEVPGARVEATGDEIAAADLVVVLTDHDAFDWPLVCARAVRIFDSRRRLAGANVEHL